MTRWDRMPKAAVLVPRVVALAGLAALSGCELLDVFKDEDTADTGRYIGTDVGYVGTAAEETGVTVVGTTVPTDPDSGFDSGGYYGHHTGYDTGLPWGTTDGGDSGDTGTDAVDSGIAELRARAAALPPIAPPKARILP